MDEQAGNEASHENTDRWLISYADFITLLFALFVLLYAISNQAGDRRNAIFDAMVSELGVRPHLGGVRPDLGESGRKPNADQLVAMPELEVVMRRVQKAIARFPNSGVGVTIDERGLVVSLAAAKFFDSGDAEISRHQLPVLAEVIRTVDRLPNQMEIDGFTDFVPIHNDRFRDNWELSAARAGSVLRYVLAHSSIQPDHLAIAGYGPYRPVADNNTEQGRALNRRVEIVVKPEGRRG
jgi:chemotaxis protein MotB